MKEQVDALIREIGPTGFKSGPHEYLGFTKQKLELLIKLVRNAALEEAAQKCENNHKRFRSYTGTLMAHDEDTAAAIRNLKEPTP